MRITILLFILAICSSDAYGQDTLYYHNGNVEIVNVLDRRSDFVKYKSLDTTDKSVYMKSFNVIDRVKFKENSPFGKELDLKDPDPDSPTGEASNKIRLNEVQNFNRVGMDAFDLVFQNVTFYYQRTFKKANYLTVGFPLSFSPGALFGKNYRQNSSDNFGLSNYYSKYKLFSTGIELTSYPDGFVYGLVSDFGLTRRSYFPYYDSAEEPIILDASFYGLFVRIGYDLNFKNKLGLSFYGNLGMTGSQWHNVDYDYITGEHTVYSFYSRSLGSRFNVRINYSF